MPFNRPQQASNKLFHFDERILYSHWRLLFTKKHEIHTPQRSIRSHIKNSVAAKNMVAEIFCNFDLYLVIYTKAEIDNQIFHYVDERFDRRTIW